MDNCRGSNSHYALFNYSSSRSTGTQAKEMTVYERNCSGHSPGVSKAIANPGASSSNNVSTGHRGLSIYRVGLNGHTSDNSFIADVQGCYSMNFGINLIESQGGGLFQNGFWYQRLSGEGKAGAIGILIGCSPGAFNVGKYDLSNWNDGETAATLGEIHIADWLGSSGVTVRAGTIVKNYETGATLI